jgi:hypothetical protein
MVNPFYVNDGFHERKFKILLNQQKYDYVGFKMFMCNLRPDPRIRGRPTIVQDREAGGQREGEDQQGLESEQID